MGDTNCNLCLSSMHSSSCHPEVVLPKVNHLGIPQIHHEILSGLPMDGVFDGVLTHNGELPPGQPAASKVEITDEYEPLEEGLDKVHRKPP